MAPAVVRGPHQGWDPFEGEDENQIEAQLQRGHKRLRSSAARTWCRRCPVGPAQSRLARRGKIAFLANLVERIPLLHATAPRLTPSSSGSAPEPVTESTAAADGGFSTGAFVRLLWQAIWSDLDVGVHVLRAVTPVDVRGRKESSVSHHRTLRVRPVAKGRITRILTNSTMRLISGEREMPRAGWMSFVATILVLSCASCTQTGNRPSTIPSATSSTGSAPAPSKPATPAIPSYLKTYTHDERNAYASALIARQHFYDRQAGIYAKGRATPGAKNFYRKYTSSWQSYWTRLRQFQTQRIRVIGRSDVISIRPAKISLGDRGGASITLKVCGDGRPVKVMQGGSPVPQPTRKTSIIEVSMVKLADENWWRVLYEHATEQPC